MPQVRDFAELTLADVIPSAAAALAVPGFTDVAGIGDAAHVVVVLIDGLGYHALDRRDPDWIDDGRVTALDSVFPTTTPVALASLGTGVLPGAHGMVGASFVLPETQEVLAPLHWGGAPVPESVQVEPTVFESMVRAGVRCSSVGPGAYATSGLTRAALRGPRYVAASTISEYARSLRDLQSHGDRSFTYLYWPELDRVGHAFGVSSPEWGDALDRVGTLLEALRSVLPRDAVLAMSSDHGMVDCPATRWIRWDDLGDLHAGVRTIAGEPRNRMIYLEDGVDSGQAARRWTLRLDSDFAVWERSDLAASGLLGSVQPFARERLGDLIVVAASDAMISCPDVDPRISMLPGQHGAWTEEERRIPLVVWQGG